MFRGARKEEKRFMTDLVSMVDQQSKVIFSKRWE